MGRSRATEGPTSGVVCIACLLGVLAMGGVLWGAVAWIARAFFPMGLN